MSWTDAVRLSVRQAVRARAQSRLTVLSVAIGVFSVVLIASAGRFASECISKELRGLGVDGLLVYLKESDRAGLDAGLGETLMREVPGVAAAAPLNVGIGLCSVHGESENAAVLGVGAGIGEALRMELLHGRLPDAADVRLGERVAVVDEKLALDYYKRVNIIGKPLTVKSGNAEEKYRICGVVRAKSLGLESIAGGNLPYTVYVPYTSAPGSGGDIRQIAVRCAEGVRTDELARRLSEYLNTRHGADGEYAVENISGYIERVEAVAGLVSGFLTAVGGVSLLVAGVGVMNSMLSAQTMRRREIGIFMAVGAQRRDVLLCYLCESALLCLSGGVAGAACCGLFLAALRGFGVAITLHAGMLAASVGVTGVCGILFGFVPAYRAATLEPVDALREA